MSFYRVFWLIFFDILLWANFFFDSISFSNECMLELEDCVNLEEQIAIAIKQKESLANLWYQVWYYSEFSWVFSSTLTLQKCKKKKKTKVSYSLSYPAVQTGFWSLKIWDTNRNRVCNYKKGLGAFLKR